LRSLQLEEIGRHMSLLQNCKFATAQMGALRRQEAIFHLNLGSWRGDLR